jgi:hypothetical protein
MEDRRARQLVERNLEILSEAGCRLPKDLKDQETQIPWRAVAGIGNALRISIAATVSCRNCTARLWLTVCCVALAISGCVRGSNIQNGEPDFPELNSRPGRVIHLSGALPESMPLYIQVSYEAEKGGFGDVAGCSFYPSERGLSPFSVDEPVTTTRTDNMYAADVVFDKYQPGRCQWSLNSIVYWVERSVPTGQSRLQDPDAYVTADKRQMVKQGVLAGDLRQDVRCDHVSGGSEVGKRYACGPLPVMVDQQDRAGGDAGVPADSAMKTLYIAPDTSSIIINFRASVETPRDAGNILEPP